MKKRIVFCLIAILICAGIAIWATNSDKNKSDDLALENQKDTNVSENDATSV